MEGLEENKTVSVVIEDANRNIYLEGSKEYREEKRLNKLITLFGEEQKFYYDQSKYFYVGLGGV